MKTSVILRLLFSCIIICGTTICFAQKFKPRYLRQNDKTLLALTTNATDDGWLEFKADGEAVDAVSFSTKFAKNIGLGEGYKLRLVRDKTDVKETRHQHYQLYYKNVLVEGGHLALHSRKDRLKAAHIRIIEDIDLAVDKPIAESRALENALADRKLTEDKLKDKKPPKGELVLTSMDGDYVKEGYRFAYAFNLHTEDSSDDNRVYVDASSGTVLKHQPLISKCFAHADELTTAFG